ncbi:MAG: hypothetical protein V8S58_14390 [Lachnospiraceae bacterium]
MRQDRKVNEDMYLVGVDALTEAVQDITEGRGWQSAVFNDYMGTGKDRRQAWLSEVLKRRDC